MEYQGICHKMRTSVTAMADQPDHYAVGYRMVLGGLEVPVSQLVGQPIQLQWTGQIFCVGCGAKTNKSYSQGYCFRCFKTRAATDLCMMKPETCHFHLGTCREPDWGESVCFAPHYVYLANSSNLKVGITRHTQLPTRWLDQGAVQAVPVMQVASRFLSGVVETLFATDMADKTDWRALLRGDPQLLDMTRMRQQLIARYQDRLEQLAHAYPDALRFVDSPVQQFHYPVQRYPSKINAHSFDKTLSIGGTLQGIKGQYWLLDTGVLNIRKFTGYELILRHQAGAEMAQVAGLEAVTAVDAIAPDAVAVVPEAVEQVRDLLADV